MKERIRYIDNLRIYAILCIVLLHIVSIFRWKYFGVNTNNYFILTLIDAFARVGLPLFFMITGVLMINKKEDLSFYLFFKKRVLRLICAYLVFSILYYLYDIITYHKAFDLFELIRRTTSSQTAYHLWFMPVIILIYLLIPFIKEFVKNLSRKQLKTLILLIFILSNGIRGILEISSQFGYAIMGNFMLPDLMGYINYLFVGYYLAEGNYKINKRLILISIISILCIPFLTIFVSKTEINDVFLNALSPLVIAPSILAFLSIKNRENIFSSKMQDLIAKCANQVFYVYLIHVLIIKIIQDNFSSLFKGNILIKDIIIMILLWIIVSILSFILVTIWDIIKGFFKKTNLKIKDLLLKILNVVIIIFFSLVLVNLIINPYQFIKINYMPVMIGILIWIGLYYLLMKYRDRLFNDKYYTIAVGILFVTIQVLIGYVLMVKPTWDFGEVYNIAVDFAKNPGIHFRAPYLYLCSNNIMFAVLFAIIFKGFYLLGFHNHFIELGIFINIIMIDIALIYTYLLIGKINDKRRKPFLFFLVMSSPLLFYVPIFYTDTISLPFMIGSIYYLYRYFYETQKTKDAVFAGIFIGVGALIKPTVLIMGVAVIIFLFLKKQKKYNRRFLMCFLIPIILFLLGQKVFINHFFDQDYLKQSELPTEHYLLIGLEGTGSFSEERYLEMSQLNHEEKVRVAKKNIRKRINNMFKNKEVLSFYNRKISFTWTDGTFFSFEKLHREPIHKDFTKYIYSNDNNDIFYWTFSNTEWIIIIVLMILGVVFRKTLPEKTQELQTIANISIVGIILFLLLWETRSRYLVNYVPIFMLNAYIGLYALSNYINLKKEGRQKK